MIEVNKISNIFEIRSKRGQYSNKASPEPTLMLEGHLQLPDLFAVDALQLCNLQSP